MSHPPLTASIVSRRRVHLTTLTLGVLLFPAIAFAQSPWERAAANREISFTGPLARSLALVALVLGGFGGGLALFAVQFLTWLFA
jgi:type IV secretory pathway VirB2 component (pilin)